GTGRPPLSVAEAAAAGAHLRRVSGQCVGDKEPARGPVADLGQQGVVREPAGPPAGSRQVAGADGGLGGLAQRLDQLVRTGRGVRGGGPQPVSGRGTGVRTRRDVRGGRQQRGAVGGGGGGGECVACPALGASEGVECGGLGERVACAAGEFDRPSGAGDRGVVQALVDECAAGLGQGQCGSGGRVVTGKLPCPGDEGVRLLPWTFPYEPAGEAVDVGGGGRQVAGGAGGVAGAER